MVLARNDRFLISGSQNGMIKVWQLGNVTCEGKKQAHKQGCAITSITIMGNVGSREESKNVSNEDKNDQDAEEMHKFSSSYRTLFLTGSEDKRIKLWDMDTLECLQIFRHHKTEIYKVMVGSGKWGTTDPNGTNEKSKQSYVSPPTTPINNQNTTVKTYNFKGENVKNLDEKIFLWSLAFENKIYKIDLVKGVSGHAKNGFSVR
jgi:WD40 repeat protein